MRFIFQEQSQQLCDVMIKKPDKKRERQILFGHRQQLGEQLVSCTDPALTLHLAVILLFQVSYAALGGIGGEHMLRTATLIQIQVFRIWICIIEDLLDPDPHVECGSGSDPGGKKYRIKTCF